MVSMTNAAPTLWKWLSRGTVFTQTPPSGLVTGGGHVFSKANPRVVWCCESGFGQLLMYVHLNVLHELLSQDAVAKCPKNVHVVACRAHSRNCLSRCLGWFQNKAYFALLGSIMFLFQQKHGRQLISNLSDCDDNLIPLYVFWVLGRGCVRETELGSFSYLSLFSRKPKILRSEIVSPETIIIHVHDANNFKMGGEIQTPQSTLIVPILERRKSWEIMCRPHRRRKGEWKLKAA